MGVGATRDAARCKHNVTRSAAALFVFPYRAPTTLVWKYQVQHVM